MIKRNILLKDMTNYKIGGPARFFLTAKNVDELKDDLKKWPALAAENNVDHKKIFVLGGGTNVLSDDQGFDGLIIHPDIRDISVIDNKVKVDSGITISELNDFLIKNGLSGFEWSGGLPGTVGGAIFGNAGAFGGEIKDNILNVESLDLNTFEIKKRNVNECRFEYRTSVFKKELQGKEVILSAIFQFEKGDQLIIKEKIDEKINYRKEHQPLELPSAGSTFKNVPVGSLSPSLRKKFHEKIKKDPFPVVPAAVFIAEAGLMGFSVGDAEVSTKHPNFIVNKGRATSQDVKAVMFHVEKTVKDRFGIQLVPEIIQV